MVLAILLFVKYIFFNKSQKFTTNLPSTPVHPQSNSHDTKTSSPASPGSTSCPFALTEADNGSITRHRTSTGLKVNVNLPKPIRRRVNGPPEEMEKIVNGGLVISSVRDSHTTTATTHRPALEGPHNQSNSNRENTDGGRIGQALRIEDKMSRADFLLSRPHCASVGVQTDPLSDSTPSPTTPSQSMFTIGGASCDGRRYSVISSPDSGIENGSLDVDTRNGELIQSAEPRSISECLGIFKSDVSCIHCTTHVHCLGV